MKRNLVLALLLVGLTAPGALHAQLQYFGYVGNGDTDQALVDTKSFTNFAHLSTTANPYDQTITYRTQAAAQRGLKVTIDLGLVLWCPEPDGSYKRLCANYVDRWNAWVSANSTVLNSGNVIAFSILDEPFARNANMYHYEGASALVKGRFPWAKIWMIEAGCIVRNYCPNLGANWAFDAYVAQGGTLPAVDWVGLDEYGIHPQTDAGYQSALQELKTSFPGKKIVYVMDAYWDPGVHGAAFGYQNYGIMASIAREWYDVARSDPDAVMLGGFLWAPYPGWVTAQDLPCTVLQEHIAIGRAITGKSRPQTSYPIGYLDGIDSSGVASGWACDPDAAICESVTVLFSPAGLTYSIVGRADLPSEPAVNSLCKTGKAHRFRQALGSNTAGREIRAYGQDLNYGSSLLPGHTCDANPACVWYPNNYQPKGFLDAISSTGYATGWTCDPDAPNASIKLEFIANGSSAGVYRADQGSESAVNNLCGGGTAHRFGVQLPAWTKGLNVTAYGIDTMSGRTNLPGWQCPQNPACVW